MIISKYNSSASVWLLIYSSRIRFLHIDVSKSSTNRPMNILVWWISLIKINTWCTSYTIAIITKIIYVIIQLIINIIYDSFNRERYRSDTTKIRQIGPKILRTVKYISKLRDWSYFSTSAERVFIVFVFVWINICKLVIAKLLTRMAVHLNLIFFL